MTKHRSLNDLLISKWARTSM